MNQNRQIPIWIFPILGVIMGILVANWNNHGVFTMWKRVKSAPENISRIIGSVDGYNLLVETISGETIYVETPHCLIYDNQGSPDVGTQAHPEQNYSSPYLFWPLLFSVKQYYQIAYFADGPTALLRFALSKNGDLWSWNFCDNGYIGYYYCLFPLLGLIWVWILGYLIIEYQQFTRTNKYIASG